MAVPPGSHRSDPGSFPTGLSLARVIAIGRWLCWVWMVLVVAIAGNRSVDPTSIRADDTSGAETALRAPALAWLAVGVVLLVCVWATAQLRGGNTQRGDGGVLGLRFATVEVAIALGLSVVDGVVFDPGHVFATSQSLATQYPVIAFATAGLALGPRIAAALGLLMGPAEWLGALLNDFDEWSLRHVFSLVATSIFFAAVGGLAGWLGLILRDVERRLADQQARDEVARVLHDTVLQTLALVEQRAGVADPELASAARRADHELRSYLFGADPLGDADDLETAVRSTVDRARDRLDLDRRVRCTVNVLDLGVSQPRASVHALVAATGEAVSNALVHAGAGSIVVFVETDDNGHVTASVRDDGVGFDVDAALSGDRRGLSNSIIDRMESIGGSARITSSADGTLVVLSTLPEASR